MRSVHSLCGQPFGDFTHYLDGWEPNNVDPAADGLRFGKVQLHLTDAEFEALLAQLCAAIESVPEYKPLPGCKRQIISVTSIPTGDTEGLMSALQKVADNVVF